MIKELLYEGKAKKIFSTDRDDLVIMQYKDSLTAFNALKKGEFAGKGELNCRISTKIFEELLKHKISSHWVKTIPPNQMLVHKTKIIPLEVVVRNYAAGSISKKLGLEEGLQFKKPLVELYYKNDSLGDPFVSDSQALLFGWADESQLKRMNELALEINQVLKVLMQRANLKLIDFKIEFGINQKGELLLSDEISPDCMRLWDMTSHEKMDKDRFRRDLGNVEQAYQEVLNRLERI